MIFWISIAIVTAIAAIVLLMPFRRAARQVTGGFAHDAEVYKDQLAEVERDEKQGLITPEQAEYARGEIGRRLLTASSKAKAEDQVETGGTGRIGKLVQLCLVIIIPLVGLGLYLSEGEPGIPDQPLEARLANPGNNTELLIAKMERHLADNPDDGEGWAVIAPVYMRLGQFDDAANAFRNLIRLEGPSAERYGELGETIVAAAEGKVTEEAQQAFSKSVELSQDNPRARFYLAMALAQGGKTAEARAAYEAIIAQSPADAPWIPLIRRAMGELDVASTAGEAPGNPTREDVEAAQSLNAEDRQDMIRSMVASLDERLKENPDNFEGWMRLVRSYVVLNDPAKAQEALKSALEQFPTDKDQGKALLALANELGLTVDGVNP